MTSPQIHVRVQDATATVCIRGRATCVQGPGLRAFILRSAGGGVLEALDEDPANRNTAR